MAAKKKGPGKGRGPAGRPPSPAKRVTIPKQATAKPPAGAAAPGTGAKLGEASPAAPPGHSGKSAGPPPTTAKAASAAPPPAKPGPSATQPGIQSATQSGKGAGKPAAQSGKVGAPPAKPGAQKGPPAAPSAKAPAPKAPAAKGPAAKGPAAKGSAITGPAAKGKAASGKGSAATPSSAPAKGRPRGGPTKEERLAAAAAERRRRAIRNKALVASGVVSVLFVVGFVLVTDRRERSKEAASFQTASCTFDRESDGDAGPGRNHVPNPSYDVNPPAGGDHTVEAAGPGIFTADRQPLEGQVVHALEHGFIVLWHRPDLDEPRLTALREVAQEHPGEVLMVPRPTLPTPLAATAWHRRLLCQDVEVDTIERFIDTFVDKGPEKGHVTRDEG